MTSSVRDVDIKEMMDKFETFLFDADGVLWLGDRPLPGAEQFVRHLIGSGKDVFIVTNNSTKTLDDYVEKCRRIGFDMVPRGHILSPAKVLARMLAEETSQLPVYIVGSTGLQRELQNEGIESFGAGADPTNAHTSTDFIDHLDLSRKVRAVVVSYDIHMSYPKIMRAANYINQPGTRFYATNEDATLPGPVPGVIVPGAGVNVRAVEIASGKEPIVIGKPAKAMFDYLKARFNVHAEKSVMFGDRCETDIKFGHTNGLTSVLVGTGVHSMDKVKEFEIQGRKDLIPTYYAPSLKALFDMLQE